MENVRQKYSLLQLPALDHISYLHLASTIGLQVSAHNAFKFSSKTTNVHFSFSSLYTTHTRPALVILSVDQLRSQPITQIVQNPQQHKSHQILNLPASYGRKPLTDKEIEVINVSGWGWPHSQTGP